MITPEIREIAIKMIGKPRVECEEEFMVKGRPLKQKTFEAAYVLSRVMVNIDKIRRGE